MHVTAIIAAGGRGTRLGATRPKPLTAVGGRPMLERSVEAFLSHPDVNEVIVALPDDLADDPPSYLRETVKPLRVVRGGLRRQDSVANAFRAASPDTDVVVIHDAARPFVSRELIARTIATAAEHGAAVAALQSRDTVKQVAGGVVTATVSRESIYLAQTPQAFRSHVLADALAGAREATDEAALAERAGHEVRVVDGDPSNIKITTPEDLRVADALAAAGSPLSRIGAGYDLHRLVEGRPLILGGVTIPFERGLLGHSDGDAVCHAVTDAVLGAAGAGDIGRQYPDTDPRWKDASSLELLREVAVGLRDRGFGVGNVDVVVIAERPKLATHVDAMRAALAGALGTTPDRVSIKGKTNEGVGELGRGEAIAVHAVALLRTTSHVISNS